MSIGVPLQDQQGVRYLVTRWSLGGQCKSRPTNPEETAVAEPEQTEDGGACRAGGVGGKPCVLLIGPEFRHSPNILLFSPNILDKNSNRFFKK